MHGTDYFYQLPMLNIMYTAPNYKLIDAYINDAVNSKQSPENNAFAGAIAQTVKFNPDGFRGSRDQLKHQLREIMAQSDYGLVHDEPPATIIDRIDDMDQSTEQEISGSTGDHKKEKDNGMDHNNISTEYSNNDNSNVPINPYIPTYDDKPRWDWSICGTVLLVIVVVGLFYILLRLMFPVRQAPTPQVEGNMNVTPTEDSSNDQ